MLDVVEPSPRETVNAPVPYSKPGASDELLIYLVASAILEPIQRMTGTAMELPSALYLGLSGVLGMMSVYPSGNP